MKIDALMTSSGVGFGTSGARGTVEAMSNTVCYAYTQGFLQAMQASGAIHPGAQVYIGGDLRASTPRILAACIRAIEDCGYTPVYVGRLPSPAVAFYAMQQQSASIMVTGSHIPDDRNGIKFNRPDGEILKPDEASIRAQEVELPEPFPEISGSQLPAVSAEAGEAYIARYTGFFSERSLAGLHIGVYQHSGVARDLFVTILEALGARVTPLARAQAFIPVDTEAIRDEDVQLAREWSQNHRFDAIVSTDGDADRPLVADENGQWLRGDIVGILCGHFLEIEHLVTPVSSNTAVEACGWFKSVSRTRIGSPYVIEQMQAQLRRHGGSVAGYEANGGFLLASDIQRDQRRLTALPTRDAVLPVLSVLVAANQQACSITQLVDALPGRFTASDRLKDFPTELSKKRISAMSQSQDDIVAAFGGLCGNVSRIDTTDGLRIVFENEEIVHLRPSGNAPELRCYNEAASVERVEQLNQACIGLLASWRD